MSFTYPNNYFLSAVTRDGFSSLIRKNADVGGYKRVYIIKGAVGTGKSQAIVAAAERLCEMGLTVWLAQNPISPDRLDGVFAPEIGVAAVNGAFPHDICERREGIKEILVDMSAACDMRRLVERRDEIEEAYALREALFARAGRYVSAAQSLQSDSFRMAADCTDGKKAAKFAMMTAAKLLGAKKRERGIEQIRHLSAITPDGIIFRQDTVEDIAETVVIVNDRFGAASQVVMTAIRYTAMELGYDIITCMCPLCSERCEHIIVPEMRVAFCTENRYHDFDIDTRRYHARRFMDMTAINSKRQRLMFNKKAVDELIGGACDALKGAREEAERLREAYRSACDKAKSEEIVDRLCRDIEADCM